MKIAKILLLFILIANLKLVNSLTLDPMEPVLLSCQATGHSLFYMCVIKPPTTPAEAAVCSSLLAKYTTCSIALNQPCAMQISVDPPDPYSWSPFSPCRFEVQRVILWDICPNTPTGTPSQITPNCGI